jgi:hypothetical protein
VHRRGEAGLADERAVGAGGDRYVGAAGQLEDADGVRRRLRQRLVARDGRDPEQLELGAREREQDRDRVVVTGVAVEQDRDRGAQRGPPLVACAPVNKPGFSSC